MSFDLQNPANKNRNMNDSVENESNEAFLCNQNHTDTDSNSSNQNQKIHDFNREGTSKHQENLDSNEKPSQTESATGLIPNMYRAALGTQQKKDPTNIPHDKQPNNQTIQNGHSELENKMNYSQKPFLQIQVSKSLQANDEFEILESSETNSQKFDFETSKNKIAFHPNQIYQNPTNPKIFHQFEEQILNAVEGKGKVHCDSKMNFEEIKSEDLQIIKGDCQIQMDQESLPILENVHQGDKPLSFKNNKNQKHQIEHKAEPSPSNNPNPDSDFTLKNGLKSNVYYSKPSDFAKMKQEKIILKIMVIGEMGMGKSSLCSKEIRQIRLRKTY